MKLEFTQYASPANLYLDTPFRDGIANIKAAFQESEKIAFEGTTTQEGRRITEEVPNRSQADKIKQLFVGVCLLIPIVNIVADLALRYFDHIQKVKEDNYYCNNMNVRGTDALEGFNNNHITGSERGLRHALDQVIRPRMMQLLDNATFQYAISNDLERGSETGVSRHFLHMRIVKDGKSVEWRRRICTFTDAQFSNFVSQRDIAMDILSKYNELLTDNFGTFASKLLQGKPLR